MEVAHRIAEIAVERYGLSTSDLIFDALTFPLSTGDDDLRRDAIYTIEAIRRIKAEIPGAHTTLGVSNISFGLNPAARHALNSVFLHECVEAGLDSAIVHAGKIVPLNRLPEEQREVCLDLVWDRRRRRLRPVAEAARGVRRRQVDEDREARPQRSARRGAPAPPDHRRRPRRAHRRPRRGDGGRHAGARHHQHRAARRDEGRRRAVRRRRDAASVRAPVGRDDEDGRRLPRAAHGEGRRPVVGEGQAGAGHGEGRRARHRQEPRRHHLHQQRLRGAQPRHQDAASTRWSPRSRRSTPTRSG